MRPHLTDQIGKWLFASLLLLSTVFMFGGSPLLAQEDGSEVIESSSELPQEAIDFHKTFLTLYLDNYERINNLKSLRSSGATEQITTLKQTLRKTSQDTLETLREQFRATQEKNTSRPILKSMQKTLEIYPIYLDKVLTNWEPSKRQELMRRRMSDNEIIKHNPKLGTPSLLRGAFLGELISNVQSVPGMSGWFKKRITTVDEWIGSKYDDVFPLYLTLLSRVQRAFNNENSGEQKRKQIVRSVRTDWKEFWQDVGEESKWQKMRDTVNRLRALFRNRGGRLPGAQRSINEQVMHLQKQIGDLNQLYIEQPFVNKENRLRMILRMCKAFVHRAGAVGNGQASQSFSGVAMNFLVDFANRKPQQFWKADDPDQLEQKKEQVVQELSDIFADLKLKNYKTERERYHFPFEDILQLVQRLGTNYGEEEQNIAKNVRDVARFVQSRYVLSKKGISIMRTYHQALKEQEISSTKKAVQFEKAFRNEYKPDTSQLMIHVNRIRKKRGEFDGMIEKVSNVKPDKLATAYMNKQDNNQE